MQWDLVFPILDKFRPHVFGHGDRADMRTLLERYGYWLEDASKYITDQVERCRSWAVCANPKPSRKVSLASLNRQFYDLLCIDHLFLDGIRVFHAMDAHTRCSAGLECPNPSLVAVTHYLKQYGSARSGRGAVHGYQAFNLEEITNFLAAHG